MSSSKRPPSRFAARRDGRRTHLRADFPPATSSSSVPPCRFRHAGSAGYRARHSSGSANRPRWLKIFLAVALSVIAAMRRIRPLHRGHARTSTA
ncbi:uncharacterized protein SOCE26_100260 [Sorangium cellulosum]|uniref:Uncharacterized protein n=1 Tax=Sorangium cellulosum TaxID=56 RepID=A0A2L0FA72_SORCE|nr:uncharacterized protein SOCE26_100260 [Sorangium cellulosum]